MVTHDPVDAYALADRVAVVEHGRIVQLGTIAEVTAHPRSRYVADLVGTNLVAGEVAGGVLTHRHRRHVVVAGDTPDGRRSPPSARRPSPCTDAGPRAAPATCGRWRSSTSTASATGSGSASAGRSRWWPS